MLSRFCLIAIVAGCLVSASQVGTAWAGDDHALCNVPLGDWQPRAAVEASLTARGWAVRSIRTDDGCYKVKAVDANGQRIRAMLNPQTLEPVGEMREEAD